MSGTTMMGIVRPGLCTRAFTERVTYTTRGLPSGVAIQCLDSRGGLFVEVLALELFGLLETTEGVGRHGVERVRGQEVFEPRRVAEVHEAPALALGDGGLLRLL